MSAHNTQMEGSTIKQEQFEVELISFNKLKGNVFGRPGNAVENITVTFTEKRGHSDKKSEAVVVEKPATSLFSIKPKVTSGFMTPEVGGSRKMGSLFQGMSGISLGNLFSLGKDKKEEDDLQIEAETEIEEKGKLKFFSWKGLRALFQKKKEKQKEKQPVDPVKTKEKSEEKIDTHLHVSEQIKYEHKNIGYFKSFFQRISFFLVVLCVVVLGGIALFFPINNNGKEETIAGILWDNGAKNLGQGGAVREAAKGFWDKGEAKICNEEGVGYFVWQDGTQKFCDFMDKTIGGKSEDPDKVEYEDVDIGRVINSGNIPVLSQPENGQESPVSEDLTRAQLLERIRKSSQAMLIGRVYFFKVYNKDQREVSFTELVKILGIRFGAGSERDVSLYRLMVYLEGKDRLRLGLMLVYNREKVPTMEQLARWENTITVDLKPMFYDGDHGKISMSGKSFKNSSVSDQRRYVNFSADQSLSLDYALAKDGIILVTSKGFGTAALDKILEHEGE